jgi:hypothetical protein
MFKYIDCDWVALRQKNKEFIRGRCLIYNLGYGPMRGSHCQSDAHNSVFYDG